MDLYFSFKSKITIIDVNSRPEIKSWLMLYLFELTMTCLKKLKLPLNFFGSAYSDQKNKNYSHKNYYCSTQRWTFRLCKILQNCGKIVVYLRPNQIFLFLYQALPAMSNFVNKKFKFFGFL